MAYEPSVLQSKINPPVARAVLVARPELVDRLDAALDSAVTLVAAPAGFGKTTLLVDWARRVAPRTRVAWLSLADADNDATRFWAGVLAALHRHDMDGVPAEEGFVEMLVEGLLDLREDVVLVLDDYHVIHTQAVHAGVLYLLEHLPERLHLLISSRADPPLPLARMRVSGQLSELRAADLRFSAQESGQFLCDVMDLPLSTEHIAALHGCTEGWPAGLQLAALSLRDRSDPTTAIAGFTGTHRFIIDYLMEEVVEHLPARAQTFLKQTSILHQLCGPLCDAVTDDEGGAAMLEQLERASLFVSVVDAESRWYRYHQLFADTLRHRLEREDPSLLPALHRRASNWYASNGLGEEAVEHALDSSDWDAAGELLERVNRAMLDRGEHVTVRRWLEGVPAQVRQVHPVLSGIYALALLVGGQLSELDRFLHNAEPALERRDQLRSLARLHAVHAQLACSRDDQSLAITCAERALAHLPAQDGSFRSAALLALGTVATQRGELTAAEHPLNEVVEITRTAFAPMARFQVRTLLAHVEAGAGRLRHAAALYAALLDDLGDRPLVMREEALLGMAALLREWNRLDDADIHLDLLLESRRKRGRDADNPPPQVWIERGRVLAARGHVGPAADALRSASGTAHQVGSARLGGLTEAYQARLALQMRDLSSALRWAQAWHSAHQAEVDPHTFEHEVQVLTLARIHLAQAEPHRAFDVLESRLMPAQASGRTSSVIEIQALRALALNQLGDGDGALEALERALGLAEPEGYVRMFVDEQEPMELLLRRTLSRGIRPRYVSALLHACGGQGAATGVLTQRERDVLRLLGEGLSNRDISERLVLSEGTVKTHVHNLISKLGVESRAQALIRAREIGVLDD